MPAHFDLLGFSEQTKQLRFVRFEKLRFAAGHLLRSVCSSHPDDWIVAPKTADEFSKAPWRTHDEPHHFVGAPDGSAVATLKESGNWFARHLKLRWKERILVEPLRPRAAGSRLFAPKIGRGNFNRTAHFKQPRPHAASNTLLERIFADCGHKPPVGKLGRITF